MGVTEFAGLIPFHEFAQWAARAAVDGLWQSAVVVVGLTVCMRLAPRVSASHRFAAWAAGFAVAAGLPLLPLVSQLTAGFTSGVADGGSALAGGAAHAWLSFDARWSLAIAGVWLAFSAYRFGSLAMNMVRLRGLWKSARPVGSEIASFGAHAFAHGRKVEICATRALDRPSVIGFFAPRILIPEWLLERLTREELEQVILHEAEHLRRWDDWTNLLQKLCVAAFPLNPALLWMDRRLAKEREMACDEGVVRITGAPRAYAACLASLAERRLENRKLANRAARAEALALGAFERRPELAQRVHSLLRCGHKLSPAAGWSTLGVVGCGLIFGAVELARCPQVVAFVPQQNAVPAMTAEAPYAMRDMSAVSQEDEGLRAVDTKAIVPLRRMSTTHPARHDAPAHFTMTASAQAATAGLHAENVKAAMRVSDAERTAQPQELLVVTWQMQTPARVQDFKTQDFRAQNVADYDDGRSNEPGVMADAAPGKPANEMAVTRMFLGIYRASEAARTAGQSKKPQSTNIGTTPAAGNTSRHAVTATEFKTLENKPTAVSFGDGWIVIQL